MKLELIKEELQFEFTLNVGIVKLEVVTRKWLLI